MITIDPRIKAEVEAKEWVEAELMPVIRGQPDGGFAMWRAIVDAVFHDATWESQAADMDGVADELLTIAHTAVDCARNPYGNREHSVSHS